MVVRMERRKGFNNDDLKKRNRGLLLKLIATGEGNTRISLAKKSGLTKMSVTNVVEEFLKMDLVTEGSREYQEMPGRNPVTIGISSKAPKIIGLLINRECCQAVLTDLKLTILKEKTIALGQDAKDQFLPNIYKLVDEMMENGGQILGIGIASIGPLDVERGLLLNPPRFFGIKNLPLSELLQERYQLPVYLDHQYHSAARAEKLFGYGRELKSFLFLGITNGIGAGIYVDGKLLKSSNGLGCELGHMSIDYRGNPCECGNRGCVETYASANVICQKVGALLNRKVDFAECCRLSEDPAVDKILRDAMDKLCVCLVSVVNLVNPEVIFLGHEGIKLPDRYLEQIRRTVNECRLSVGYGNIEVRRTSFGEKAQLIGAACNVLDLVFSGKLLF